MRCAAKSGWCSSPLTCSRRSEEHTSELQSQSNLVCRLLLEKKKYSDLPPNHLTASITGSRLEPHTSNRSGRPDLLQPHPHSRHWTPRVRTRTTRHTHSARCY